MSQHIFALVDCNNFYASCEKLFRPDLADTPVVVLSNNDGCVVARSREAKKLGIKMGVPVFQVRELMQKQGVVAFSSNYALYADMSQRVMSILEGLAPRVEVYSIDESFLDLTGVDFSQNLTEFGLTVRQIVQKCTGITVCVGIAPTKTLAKLANHAAKTWPKTRGVVDLTSKERQRKLLALLPINEVWGIGGKLTKRLQQMGIDTALQLAGRDVYIREGCYNCHSQMIRPFRAETLRYGHYSVAGESVYDHPFQWGSKRTGPDLARVGGKYSDEWHRIHLVNPRDVVPESNMPAYPWLEKNLVDAESLPSHLRALRKVGVPYTDEQIAGAAAAVAGKTEMDALVAYLQGLGKNAPKGG